MSNNSNSRTASSRGTGSLIAAVMVGIVLGLILAGVVAWYILERPNPFVNTSPRDVVKLEPDPVKPVPVPVVVPPTEVASSVAASGVGEAKPRFEFYKVLTDKNETVVPPKVAPKPVDKPAAKEIKEVKEKEIYFLQAGAFTSIDDADKMKARLAMLGLEANVQVATLPDKTVWHRVRLGPFKNTEEMNKTSAMLKQNGVNSTPMRAQ